jgi:type I restriction enzyme S subunit
MGDPVARACFVPKKAKRYLMASDGIRLVIDEMQFDKYFVFSYINSKYFRNKAIEVSTGSTRQRIGLPKLKSIKLIKPTLTEQKAIATALSDVDDMIAKLEKLIEKKKAIKQGALQQLLTPPHKGGKRLEGFSGEWVERRLGDIGKTFGGLTGKTKRDFENGDMPFITFLNVLTNVKIKSEFAFVRISPNEVQNIVKYGDLLFNTSSETPEEVGMCAVLLDKIPNLYLNSFCFGYRLIENSQCDGLFMSYLINSDIGRSLFQSLAQGATRYNLSKSNFNNVKLTVPQLQQQKVIARILADMDSEIEQFDLKKLKLYQLKQGMMQELLTGRTRLV